MVSKASNASFFDCNEHSVIICKLSDEVNVQWLHESGVGYGDTKVWVSFLNLICGLDRLSETSSNRKDSNTIFAFLATCVGIRTVGKTTRFTDNSSFADRQNLTCKKRLYQAKKKRNVLDSQLSTYPWQGSPHPQVRIRGSFEASRRRTQYHEGIGEQWDHCRGPHKS